MVNLARKYDHITPVMKSLQWLPESQRITFKICLLTHKAINGLARIYVKLIIIIIIIIIIIVIFIQGAHSP